MEQRQEQLQRENEKLSERKQEIWNRNSNHVSNTDVTKEEIRVSKQETIRKHLNTKYGLLNKQVESLPDTTCCW